MKITDYCPRAAPFDSYLTGSRLVGFEVGVDVGAHAEALLRYCDIAHLTLVDPWPNPYMRGYCVGRLLPWRSQITWVQSLSVPAGQNVPAGTLDFVYIDQKQDFHSVDADLHIWWPTLKAGGLLGQRNYSETVNPGLKEAVDKFVEAHHLTTKVETGEIILFKP